MAKSSQPNEAHGAPRSRLSRVTATVMDDCIRIPGTNWRIGLDPIIGLIPGVGDGAGAAASTLIIGNAVREGIPTVTLLRMIVNVLINTLLGALPFIGDFFSAWFKSNRRNYELLQRHAGSKTKPSALDWAIVIGFVFILIGLVIGIALFAFWIIGFWFNLFSSMAGSR